MYRRISLFIGSLLLAAIALLIFPSISAAQTGPCLDVSHDSLIFYGDICDSIVTAAEADSQSFAVMNCGTDSLNWYIYASQPWLGFTPASGTNFDSVYVFIKWSEVPIPIDLIVDDSVFLSGTVWVVAPGATPDTLRSVVVGLWVTCNVEGPPDIIVQPSTFAFTLVSGRSTYGDLNISEAHGDTVMVDVVSAANWLTVPLFFAPIYTPMNLQFGVSAVGLVPGTYSSFISVRGFDPVTSLPFDTEFVNVTLTVVDSSRYTIQASPDLFTYHLQTGDSVIGESLLVSEAGGASINFWTYNQESWLFVDTFAASPLYTPEYIKFDIHTDGLSGGFNSDSIFIWGDSAGPDPLLVPIQVFLNDTVSTSAVATRPTSFSFVVPEGSNATDSLFVYETTGANVNFIHTNQSAWLVVDPLGIYPYQTPTSMIIAVNAAQLPTGIYTDTIRIIPDSSGANSYVPVSVPVSLQVTSAQSQVMVVPTSVSVTLDTGLTTTRSVVVFDQMGANYAYAVSADPGNAWLQLQTTAGTMPDSIFFDVSSAGLSYGTYTDTLVVYNPLDDSLSPYFERRVPVNLVVVPDTGSSSYIVRANPTSLQWRFPPHTGAQSYVLLYEQAGRSGSFLAWKYAPWFDFWVPGQVGPIYNYPCSLYVFSTDSMMTPGFYHDSIWVWPDTDGFKFTPLAIPISLEALPDEPIMAYPNSFWFTTGMGDSLLSNSFVVHSPGTLGVTYDIYLKHDSPWIDWQYPSGMLTVLPRTLDTVFFDIVPAGLAPGLYVDTFVIFNPLDSGAGYFEIYVPIALTVTGAVGSAICGDINNDGFGPDIVDLTYLVSYMFDNGPPPPSVEQVKFTGSVDIDIASLTALVDFMFRYGPPLSCPFD